MITHMINNLLEHTPNNPSYILCMQQGIRKPQWFEYLKVVFLKILTNQVTLKLPQYDTVNSQLTHLVLTSLSMKE